MVTSLKSGVRAISLLDCPCNIPFSTSFSLLVSDLENNADLSMQTLPDIQSSFLAGADSS
jgi:hypothetical protein